MTDFVAEPYHEDSPECRAYNCSRLVRHEGDLCDFHLSDPDTEDAEIAVARRNRGVERSWERYQRELDEYDPGFPSETERLWHPEEIA